MTRIPRTEDTFIRTFTGRRFWPLDPRADEIFVEDVAHHLSLECRFTGATYCQYSVADHSLRVSKLAERIVMGESRNVTLAREVALWGLLHDASEAYLRDLPKPLKYAPGLGTIYREVERMVMDEVVVRFDLIPHEPAVVKEADTILLNTEKRDLMTGCQERPGVARLPETIFPLDHQRAEVEFLRRFEALTTARKAERAANRYDLITANIDTEVRIAAALAQASREVA